MQQLMKEAEENGKRQKQMMIRQWKPFLTTTECTPEPRL